MMWGFSLAFLIYIMYTYREAKNKKMNKKNEEDKYCYRSPGFRVDGKVTYIVRETMNGQNFLVDEFDQKIIKKSFKEILEFKDGFIPVADSSGAYHLNSEFKPAYSQRFKRTFWFRNQGALVVYNDRSQHFIDHRGNEIECPSQVA